jgi:hypothetical protein
MLELFLILVAFFLLAQVYLLILRPWQLRWGSSDEEVARAMPGDDLVQRPNFNATRAITVRAQPEHIWPWVAQIGIRQGGWYSYDWIDNLGVPSASIILPEYQNPQPGNLVPMSPGGNMGLYIKALNPPFWMLWWDQKGHVSWLWNMTPINEQETRLITRVRMRYQWFSPTILFDLLLDFGDVVMMQKCLTGIKDRAEKLAVQRSLTP